MRKHTYLNREDNITATIVWRLWKFHWISSHSENIITLSFTHLHSINLLIFNNAIIHRYDEYDAMAAVNVTIDRPEIRGSHGS